MNPTYVRFLPRYVLQNSVVNNIVIRCYAKAPVSSTAGANIPSLGGKKGKLKGATTAPLEKVEIPYETDVNRLVAYCCGSDITTKGEDVKLKDDSEYPDWLWKLNIGPLPSISELDPDTGYYWYRVRRAALQRNNRASKVTKIR